MRTSRNIYFTCGATQGFERCAQAPLDRAEEDPPFYERFELGEINARVNFRFAHYSLTVSILLPPRWKCAASCRRDTDLGPKLLPVPKDLHVRGVALTLPPVQLALDVKVILTLPCVFQ